jgi:hypothetical protein
MPAKPTPLTEQDVKSAQAFVDFTYQETKDLAKQVLTVVAAVLALSVTFADKVVNFSAAARPVRVLTLISWGLSILAFVCGGAAIFWIFNAGLSAKYEATHRYTHPYQYGPIGGRALACMTWGGLCFVLSLAVLVCAELF